MHTPSDLEWRILEHDGFVGQLGPVEMARAAENDWRFRLDLEKRHMNTGGVAHGGVSLTLLDTGMGRAVWQAGGKALCATIQLDSHFIAAGKLGERIDGKAWIIRRTAELAFAEGELWSGGRQIMRASGVWKYLTRR